MATTKKSTACLLASVAVLALAGPLYAQENNRRVSGEWIDPDPRIAAAAWLFNRPPLFTETTNIAVSVTLMDSSGVAGQIFLDNRLTIDSMQTLNVKNNVFMANNFSLGADVTVANGAIFSIGGRLDVGLNGMGTVMVSDGQLILSATGDFRDKGEIQVAGGPLRNQALTDAINRAREDANYVPPKASGKLEVAGSGGKVVTKSISVGASNSFSLSAIANNSGVGVGGDGVLKILDQGSIETDIASINRNGTGTVRTGGILKIASQLTTSGALTIDSGGSVMVARGDSDPPGSVLVTTVRSNSQNPESIGVVTIDGAGSILSVNGTVRVQPADGPVDLLIISRSAALRANIVVLERNARTLLTQSSSLRADDSLDIQAGEPTSLLSIAGGSSVTAPVIFLGVRGTTVTGDAATIEISGAGSSLIATSSLKIGRIFNAPGRIMADDGATVGSPIVWIGQSSPVSNPTLIGAGIGEITLAGTGSRLLATTELVIGGKGNGTLRVADGGKVEAHVVYLGREPADPRQPVSPQGTLIIGGGLALTDLDQAAGTLDIETDINIGPSGRIIFNHIDGAYSFAATVESDAFGTGLIEHRRGASSLDGDMDRFTGNIVVSGGSLDVNVETGTSNVTVRNGGRLGGTGNLAGPVAIETAGTLAGRQGTAPLTMQTLLMQQGARLNIALTGALTPNPIFDVRGNVTLNGSINITANPTLGQGLYRIINYGGSLTDNILDIGTVSAGLDAGAFSVFLGAPGQVNLLFGGGGGGSGGAQTAIGNGNGTILIGGGGWLDGNGNAVSLRSGDFLILSGTGGALTTDDSGGAIDLGLYQFASDGFVLNGDPITLNAALTAFRVGDGSAQSTEMTATINSALIGAGGIEKTDLGTLILAGANSFGGGTSVAQGILRGNAGSLGGAIDIGADGTLVFDQVNDGSFDGTLGGLGTLRKLGAGVLTLTGDSAGFGLRSDDGGEDDGGDDEGDDGEEDGEESRVSARPVAAALSAADTTPDDFVSVVRVEAGTLNVTGELGGQVEVSGGAVLAGTGQLGGEVIVSDGSIAPGDIGAVGTMTLGALFLTENARLDFQLGEPGTPGVGSDLITIGGDLTLDGTLDVSDAGGFGVGLYRLIDYAGSLTDNGLDIGAVPEGFVAADLAIVTATAAQVNLLVGAQAPVGSFAFWDGAGTAGNGLIDGGSGTWSATGSNWTLANGASNGVYDPAALLIFAGAAGTVTIDNGAGAVFLGNGAQFAVNAYRVTGGPLRLDAAETMFRVGDGTAEGAGFVAVIDSAITGPGGLVKTDLGTLILDGDNSFARLDIAAGTVRVGSNTAAGTGGISLNSDAILQSGGAAVKLDNGVTTTGNGVVNVRAGDVLTLNGVVGGAGGINQAGPGTLVLNGDNGFTNLGINAGTVQVGSNTAAGIGFIALNSDATLQSGGAAIALANGVTTTGNGLVNVRSGEVLTLNGAVGGAGSITQTGGGTLVLGGSNTFNNLVINAGTVQLASNTAAGIGGIALNSGATLQSGGAAIALANAIETRGNGLVNARTGEALTLNGSVGSAGAITKLGAGALNLNAANTYGGGTTLTAGTIGFSTNTSMGTGAITVNAGSLLANGNNLNLVNILEFSGAGTIDTAANALTISGIVGGSGRITKAGAGNLTLTGANAFTGGMTIAAGTVMGSTANLGAGGILNNGALVINQPIDATFDQVISGAGSVTKSGAGVLTLASVNTVTGPTTVSAGRLNVRGSLANSALTIQSGATLGGNGTVGALTVQSGGRVEPGNSVGTLTVNGAFTLAAGAIYVAELAAASSDLIAVNGPASIAGNLALVPTGSFSTFNASYTLVSSTSRTGSFANVTGLDGFGAAFKPVLVDNGTSVTLRLAPASLIVQGGATLTGNSLAVASAFDRAVAAGYNPQPFFALFNQGSNLPAAFAQLSGELHSAERRVLVEDTRVVREAAFDRLNAGLSAVGGQAVTTTNGETSMTAWLRVAGSWGTASTDGAGSRFTTEQTGFLTGLDYTANAFKIGAMFHHTRNDVELASLGSSRVESTGGALYGGWRRDGGFAIGAGGSIADNQARGTRAITIAGLGQSLRSQVDGTTYQVFGEIAYDLADAEQTRIEPFARIAYAKVDSGALNETGGSAALVAGKQSVDLTQMTFGMRGGYVTGRTTLSGSAGWLRSTGDRSGTTIMGITGLGTTSSIEAIALDKDALALEAQARISLNDAITLGVGYSGIMGSNNNDHGARATLTIGF